MNLGSRTRARGTPTLKRRRITLSPPRPLHHAEYEKVFRKDRANLIDEVEGLVRSTSARKVDDLVRRGRLALVHVRLCELAPRPEKKQRKTALLFLFLLLGRLASQASTSGRTTPPAS